jgi:hypothetical protein
MLDLNKRVVLGLLGVAVSGALLLAGQAGQRGGAPAGGACFASGRGRLLLQAAPGRRCRWRRGRGTAAAPAPDCNHCRGS